MYLLFSLVLRLMMVMTTVMKKLLEKWEDWVRPKRGKGHQVPKKKNNFFKKEEVLFYSYGNHNLHVTVFRQVKVIAHVLKFTAVSTSMSLISQNIVISFTNISLLTRSIVFFLSTSQR